MVKSFLAGTVAGLVAAAAAGLAVALGGTVSVAATWRDPPPLAWLLHTAYERSIARRAAGVAVPLAVEDPDAALAGARAFEEMCAICHTPPGREPTVQSAGLNPAPPRLAELARRRTPAQAFWVIRNGVRMTAMPAFGPSHTDAQLWQLVAFLQSARSLDGADYDAWLARAGQLPTGDGHAHLHGPGGADAPDAPGAGSGGHGHDGSGTHAH